MPSVVSAVKFGASSPSRTAMVVPPWNVVSCVVASDYRPRVQKASEMVRNIRAGPRRAGGPVDRPPVGAMNLRAERATRRKGATGHGDDEQRVLGHPAPEEAGHPGGLPGRGRVGARAGSTRSLGALPAGAQLRTHARGRLDVIVFFVTRRAELARRFPSFARALEPDGGLWVAWPKKTSGVATDLAFDAVQQIGLDAGLVDNKVCRDRRHLVGPALRLPRRGPAVAADDSLATGVRHVWTVRLGVVAPAARRALRRRGDRGRDAGARLQRHAPGAGADRAGPPAPQGRRRARPRGR